jgi:hypothetical protein
MDLSGFPANHCVKPSRTWGSESELRDGHLKRCTKLKDLSGINKEESFQMTLQGPIDQIPTFAD